MAPHPLRFSIETLDRLFGRRLANQNGLLLPLVLSYILIFTAEIAGVAEYAANTSRLVQSQQYSLRTFYLADAACEKALAAIRLYVATNGVTPSSGTLNNITTMPNVYGSGVSFNDVSVAYANGGAWTQKVLTVGNYAGLNANTQTINIAVTATDNSGGVTHRSTLNEAIEAQLIPIFQFGVFYQNDLEILPGANMTFTGPVHSNQNIYVGVGSGSTSTLHFDSTITAHGNIYHSRKDGSSIGTGNVFIEDANNVDQNMKNPGGGWLDSNQSDWATASQSRWGGNVASAAQNVPSLTLPIPSGSQPHALIERRSGSDSVQVQAQKMDYKANLRIVDGAVMDAAGNAVDLRYCSGGGMIVNNACPSGQTLKNPLVAATFYNFREAKTMSSTDINVSVLNGSPAFQNIVNANNGVVIYFSDRTHQGSTTNEDVVRLVNGSALPTKGLTLASENPMYVKGDYNTINKQPSGLVSDAFNILSNAWNDANSTNTNLSNKNASATTINTTVITGNTNTTSGNYNGGFENIHRFHENWSGVTLTYSGSAVVLFNSQTATGGWIYGGNYYTAPNRSWGFDTALSNPNYSIPGFPSVFAVTKASWEAV